MAQPVITYTRLNGSALKEEHRVILQMDQLRQTLAIQATPQLSFQEISSVTTTIKMRGLTVTYRSIM